MSLNNDSLLIYNSLFLDSSIQQNISILISGAERIGSSWCSLSLAHALNLEKKRILLVDGNGKFSNISSYILLNTPPDLSEYFSGNKTLAQLIIQYRYRNFHIITAEQGSNYLSYLPLGRIQIFANDLKILAQNYDHVFIDIGTELNEKNLSLCQIANNVLILSSENNEDLIKTFDLIKFLNSIDFNANYGLIINKVNSFEDGYKIYEKLCKASDRIFLKCPDLLGIVRVDTRIRDTIRNKELLLTRYPSSEAALDICQIAQKLSQGNLK